MIGTAIPSLKIGALKRSSLVNGPGKRFVVWVQGCDLGCPGCINHEFWPPTGGTVMNVEDLHELIVATPGIEGVTYSGGEPFQQAEALFHLSSLISRSGLSVMSYSGYTLDEIRANTDPYATRLLSLLDVLVDGRFRKEQSAHLLWRGSRNQRVHFLSGRYRGFEPEINSEVQEVEIQINGDMLSMTGNLDWRIVQSIKEGLAQHGVVSRNDKV